MKLDQGCCFQATTDWSLDTFLTLSLLEKANLITSKRIRLTLTFLFGVCFVSVHEIKYYLLLLLYVTCIYSSWVWLYVVSFWTWMNIVINKSQKKCLLWIVPTVDTAGQMVTAKNVPSPESNKAQDKKWSALSKTNDYHLLIVAKSIPSFIQNQSANA